LSKGAQKLQLLAKFYEGVHEAGGNNRGPMVEAFQRAVDGRAIGEAWCMAFVQFCVREVERAHGLTSRIRRSEGCLDVWEKTPVELRLEKPEPGCLVIWQHGKSWQGHVGIVQSVGVGVIDTTEGNTGPVVGVQREGDGVYARRRSKIGEGEMRVKGFLRVFE
jgi:hypothetical protein